MKRTSIYKVVMALICAMMCLMATRVAAQTEVTVEKAGTLSTVLANTEKSIKVTGPLNGTDFKYLRELVSSYSLTSIDLSGAQVVSGGDAYLDSYTTEDNVIGQKMFYECSKLTTFVLPNSLTAIGSNAFARTGLKKIELPNMVTSVGEDGFAYCTSLTTVVIGKKVAKLSKCSFYGSAVTNAYFKPTTPPTTSSYEFSSSPKIHVYSSVLTDYKATDWKSFGTLVGDLDNTYPYEKDAEEKAADVFVDYFDDVLCTQLKAEYAAMSDEDLTTQMAKDSLTEEFMNIVLKIKNDSWAEYEKHFRIHQYKAYSDAAYWNDKLKATGGSYMGNPTGIYVKGTENLYVFVGDDIPSDATLYMAGCTGNDLITSATTGKKLVKGLNIVPGTTSALYYIVYTANTKSMTKKLSEWPVLNIHVEGGVVNGYYELSHHNDAEFLAILKNATNERFTVKGDESLFNFKTQTYRDVWPKTIDKSICWFDSVAVWQKELMGLCERVALGERDFYPHNVSGGDSYFPSYYNNPNFAVEGEADDAGWANSTSYRTMYNTEACVKASFDFENLGGVDDWCAGHECGHNNQSTVSLEGCGEVSNNLFANMVRFIDGLVTSTGTTVMTTMDDYANNTPFYFRSVDSRIHMYHQLYLYFHAARRNTAFFPTLFQELRKSPLTLYGSNNYSGSLKFVRMCCKVAQQDLTDFFRAWGFFIPGTFNIEDYGDHTIVVRQYDITRTLKEISQYPTKNTEILFVEDRVKDVLSTGFPTVAGQKRRKSEVIGQCGDVGQFTDYMEGGSQPSEYTYSRTDSLCHMTGAGGVGFILKDADDNMLYASNSRSFRIPKSIGNDFIVYSVDSDGTLHQCKRNGEAVQVVKMTQAGGLQDTISSNIAGVKIVGPMNGTDFKRLRQALSEEDIISIDLAKANVKYGGLSYYNSLRTTTNVFGESMFYGFTKLKYFRLPETITKVGKQSLGKTGIKTIEIPNTVTTIDMDACAYCDDLTECVIGEKVKTIAQGAFYSSPITDAYVKPTTPPTVSSYLFSSNPTIHVHKASLAKYEASSWANYGTIVGDLDDWEEEIANGLTEVNKAVEEGSTVTIYSIDGTIIAQTTGENWQDAINKDELKGKVVIVKTGSSYHKIMVR